MAQSILIVKYNLPLSIGEIFRKLDKKKFKIKYDDENNQDKKIELQQEISNLKRNNFGVEGYVKYYYQKENEFKGEGIFDVTAEEFTFLFVPSSNLVILHGNPNFRVRLMKFFADILHDGDNLFEGITIEKEKLHTLMMKILGMKSGKNNLEEAKFYHNDRPLGKLKKLSFTTIPDFCGTDHTLFASHYKNCIHWGCVLRVYKCNGLMDSIADKGYMLRINKDATVSFGIDKNLTEWNRFVVETMKPVLKF
jgi:hypothetical protein